MNASYTNWLVLVIGLAIGAGFVTVFRNQKVSPLLVEAGVRRSEFAEARKIDESPASNGEGKTKRKQAGIRHSDAGQLTFLSNGNIVVPAELADRIRIRAMDDEGNLNTEELTLIGLSVENSKKLQMLLDGLKKWEFQREASQAEVVRKTSSETVIRIPGRSRDEPRKQEFDEAIEEIFGRSRPFVAGSLSHVGSLTSGWGAADLVATARPIADGYTEYKLFGYDPSRPPKLGEGSDPSVGAISIRSFRCKDKEVPERLQHLFD